MICIWSTLIEVNAKFWHAHFHVPHPFAPQASRMANASPFEEDEDAEDEPERPKVQVS